jgi:hypothetical protein
MLQGQGNILLLLLCQLLMSATGATQIAQIASVATAAATATATATAAIGTTAAAAAAATAVGVGAGAGAGAATAVAITTTTVQSLWLLCPLIASVFFRIETVAPLNSPSFDF